MKTMKKLLFSSLAIVLANAAQADIALFEWGMNKDGVITGVGDPIPGGTFDTSTGLGTVTVSFSGAGPHTSIFFVDHELSESRNTFFNELGEVSGVPPAGLAWEIDEPGFSASPGNIFGHFLANSLDNTVGKATPDDVSMALGWNFILGAGQTATVTYMTSVTAPTGGFYLRQYDPDSDEAVYFTTNLRIDGSPNSVPEGTSTLGLLLTALLGLCMRARKT